MQRTHTDDLEIIKKDPRRFTWGAVTKVHTIGRYDIVEYEPEMIGNETPRREGACFHIYVDGQSLSRSCYTLEAAFVFAFAKAKLGEINLATHMAQAAVKLLDLRG